MASLAPTSSIPRTPAASLRRNPAAPWRHLDVSLIGATVAIACLGTLMVYSATHSTQGTTFLVKQGMFFGIGLGVLVVTSVVDYRRVRDMAPVIYAGCVAMLAAVLVVGDEVNGSQSWFDLGAFQLQPAEMTKLAVIVLLAAVCERNASRVDGWPTLTVLGLTALPFALIVLQPDVGSALVFVAVALGILVVAGASPRTLTALLLVGVLGILAIFELDLIEDYQKDRLTDFASPGGNVSESGYTIEQSKTAIGAGGFTGAGLFQGTQTKLEYVPEQQTDFIFTALAEELGFVGCATLLLLYAVLVWRIWHAAQVAKDALGTLVCVGVLAMLLFQVFENVGMTMGIMPITGIPLPFMSYGGSSTLTMFAAIGLVTNVHMRRFS